MFFGGLLVGVIVAFVIVIIVIVIGKWKTKKLREEIILIEEETKKLEEETKQIKEETKQLETQQLEQTLNIQLIYRYDGYNRFNIIDYSKIDNEIFSKFIFGLEQ